MLSALEGSPCGVGLGASGHMTVVGIRISVHPPSPSPPPPVNQVPEMFPAFTVPSSLLPDISKMFNLVLRSQSAVSLCISADPAMTSRGTWTFVSVVLY